MARNAITRGNIDISRLYANPAALFHDQSLLNLSQKACNGLVSLPRVCITNALVLCFMPAGFFGVLVAITIPRRSCLFSKQTFFAGQTDEPSRSCPVVRTATL